MIPNDRAFNGKSSFEYDDKTYHRWYYLKQLGDCTIKINYVSSNSNNEQGIALFFSNFKGNVLLNGKQLKVLNGLKHYVFYERDIKEKGVELTVHNENGYLYFGTGANENGIFRCGSFACAFYIEEITKNHYRFYCNDFEMDDDFDDFIFDIIIEKI